MSQSQFKSSKTVSISDANSLAEKLDPNHKLDSNTLYDLDDENDKVFFEQTSAYDAAIEENAQTIAITQTLIQFLTKANLSNFKIEQLTIDTNFLNKLHAFLYINLFKLKNTQEPSLVQQAAQHHLEAIDSVFEYLKWQPSNFKLDYIESFLLACLHSISNLVHLSEAERFDSKIMPILDKIYNVIENKLFVLDVEECSEKNAVLFKATKYIVYLIEKIDDSKSVVLLWRIFYYLVLKNKALVQANENEKYKFVVVQKIFLIFIKNQKTNLTFIKSQLKKQSSEMNSNQTQMQKQTQSISSQMKLDSNCVQNTMKVAKLGSFLFKLFKLFVKLHLSDLIADNDAAIFHSLTTLSVQLCTLFLEEPQQHSIDLNTQPQQSFKEFYEIKRFFITEYALTYESLIQNIITESIYLKYLRRDFNPETSEEESFTIHEFTLYYALIVNKVIDAIEYETTMERLVELIGYCEEAIFVPRFYLHSKNFAQDNFNFNKLVDLDLLKSTTRVEFYDLVLMAMGKFTLGNKHKMKVYYLSACLVSLNTIKCQLACDLFIFLVRHFASTSNHPNNLQIVKFLSNVYESSGLFRVKKLLEEIFNYCPSSNLSNLEQFYEKNNMYRCLSIHNPNKSSHIHTTMTINCSEHSIFLIEGLLKLFNSTPSVQMSLRKSLQFIQSNKMAQTIDLCAILLRRPSTIASNLGYKLANKLIEFFKFDQIDTLLINSENQRQFYQLFLRALNLCAIALSVSSSVEDEAILFLLDFYIKNCKKSSSRFACESLKFKANEYLYILSKRKMPPFSQPIQDKIIELFKQLLSTNEFHHSRPSILKYFAFECLNEYSNSSEKEKNHIFCQISRSSLNQLVSDYLLEIKLDDEFNITKYLADRVPQRQQTLSQQQESNGNNNLDETMNVLMSAASMETTFSENDQLKNEDVDDEMTVEEKGIQEKLEKMQNEIKNVLEMYEPDSIPKWLQIQIQCFQQIFSKIN